MSPETLNLRPKVCEHKHNILAYNIAMEILIYITAFVIKALKVNRLAYSCEPKSLAIKSHLPRLLET